MPGKNYAVLIGIDEYADRRLKPLRYAEKDCRDFSQLLSDRSLSAFAQEDITVLTGSEGTKVNIEKALYTAVVKKRSAEDRVLVYFSGHGFIAGAQDLAYLATHDVNISDLLDNPNQGLRMDRLHDDILLRSPAGQVLFILDCCHSGALTPNMGGTRGAHESLVSREFFSTGKGKLAIVSCPPDSVCRESTDLKNGIFTHFLLRGLRGEATESGTGEVTVDSLLAFVRAKTPSDQPPGSYGQAYGRIVLTSPGQRLDTSSQTIRRHGSERPASSIVIASLGNPLDTYIPFIDTLVARLSEETAHSQGYLDRRILEILRQVSVAEFLFLLRFDTEKKEYVVKAHSEIDSRFASSEWMECAVNRAVDAVDGVVIPKRIRHSVRSPCESSTRAQKHFIVIPVGSAAASNEYLVVYGIEGESFLLNDAYCNILRALYAATQSLTSLKPKSIKAALLDNLKRDFSHVPLSMYETRLSLFKERLRELTIHFQPVLRLEVKSSYICGWEALARDPSTQLAPTDIFQAAQIWGRHFLVELDICLARCALGRYRAALREARMQRPYEIQDLSINAYPSSLMRPAYFESLHDALKENGFSGRNVVIEILEKEAVPEEARDLKTYRSRLERISRELHVTFGIDDFGVGHSSIERLAQLDVQYVKIDRELLHLESTRHAIKFVLDMVSFGRMSPVKVIVEGFDGSGKIDLKELYGLGIRYIQGYAFGKAGAHLYRIKKEEVSYLEGLLQAA